MNEKTHFEFEVSGHKVAFRLKHNVTKEQFGYSIQDLFNHWVKSTNRYKPKSFVDYLRRKNREIKTQLITNKQQENGKCIN